MKLGTLPQQFFTDERLLKQVQWPGRPGSELGSGLRMRDSDLKLGTWFGTWYLAPTAFLLMSTSSLPHTTTHTFWSRVTYAFQSAPLYFLASSRIFHPHQPEGGPAWLPLAPSRSHRALHLALHRATDHASVGPTIIPPRGRRAASDPLPGDRPLRCDPCHVSIYSPGDRRVI